MKRCMCLIAYVFVCSMTFYSCNIEETTMSVEEQKERAGKEESIDNMEIEEPAAAMDSDMEKGYDLPVDTQEKDEAERDFRQLMALLADIYKNVYKGSSFDVVLDRASMKQISLIIKEQGYPVISSDVYSNMRNYKDVEDFLINAELGNRGSVVIYEIHSDGGISRQKYIYDGKDMFLLESNAVWGEGNKSEVAFISYTRLKEWRYSDKGWFCYKLCVPEYPKVTEVVDGSCLIRIKPMNKMKQKLSKQCVLGLGYQGNNLLCSNWDEKNLEKLDYNGLYEYLYEMKYKEKYNNQRHPNGIPKDQFESLIMEYLPVTSEMIQKYAVFDKKHKTYAWSRLGCFNYVPTYFGTSVPEVTKVKKNLDGTVTLTVDAVCEMILCDEAVITHKLKIRFAEDGSFRYLGNEILNGGIHDIPKYQYRVREE